MFIDTYKMALPFVKGFPKSILINYEFSDSCRNPKNEWFPRMSRILQQIHGQLLAISIDTKITL